MVTVTWEQLGLSGSYLARDLWWHENLGIATNSYRVVLPEHIDAAEVLARSLIRGW